MTHSTTSASASSAPAASPTCTRSNIGPIRTPRSSRSPTSTRHRPSAARGPGAVPDARINADYRALLDDPQRRCCRDPAAAPSPCRGGAGRHRCRQARLAAEADDDARSPRPTGWSRGRKPAGVAFKVFENFIFYPPIDEGEGADRRRRDRHALTIRIKSNPGRSATAWERAGAADAWRQDPAQNGGGPLVFDDGHHKFAIAWHFMGLAEEVHAWIGTTQRARRHGLRRAGDDLVEVPRRTASAISRSSIRPTSTSSPSTTPRTTGSRSPARAGVIWINRGHGRLGDQPPVMLYAGDRARASASPMPISAGRRASSIRRAISSTALRERRRARADRRGGARRAALHARRAAVGRARPRGARRRGGCSSGAAPAKTA